MKDDEYYKAIAKAVVDWRRQNIFALQEITRVNKTIRFDYSMLKDMERSMENFRTIQEQISSVSASMKNIESIENKFKTIQEQIRSVNTSIRPIEFAFGRNIREANLQMSAVLVSLKPYQDIVKRIQEDQCRWVEPPMTSIGVLSQTAGITAAIRRDFSLMASAALFAQQSVARINFKTIGEVAKITDHERVALCQRLIDMADSYRSLWDTFHIDSQKIFSVPLVVTKVPSIEIYLAAHQAEVSTIKVEVLPEDEEFLAEIKPSIQHMREAIASIDESLIPLYEGAIHAIESNNADHVRHATVSLRELFTHILYKLAPDDTFFEWNQDESNVYNGRPTRRGRLLYICRNINCDTFITFINRDISAALEFHDLFNKGIHAIEKPYNKKQMRVLLIRMECLIDFIIRISREV